jgi:hypothetical protein
MRPASGSAGLAVLVTPDVFLALVVVFSGRTAIGLDANQAVDLPVIATNLLGIFITQQGLTS